MAARPNPAKDSMAPSVFASEIDGFTQRHKLSKRESDIVMVLIRNITNSEEIAETLGISTHTVNNHLKSIFEKTGTSSKTEILSSFLRFAANCLQNRSLFVRKPRVLVIDDEQMICEFIATGLHDRGMRTYQLTDPSQAVDLISKFNIDFVVCDIRMPGATGMDVLKKVRETYKVWPYFVFITGYPDYTLEECMAAGAAGFIEKPLDIEVLFRMIMEHLVESGEERSELLKLKGSPPVVLSERCQISDGDLGFGGAFVAMDSGSQKKNKLGIGSLVEMTINPPRRTDTLKVKGQVVWKRTSDDNGLRPGVGVKFIEMSERDQNLLDELIRAQDIRSFIPMGAG